MRITIDPTDGEKIRYRRNEIIAKIGTKCTCKTSWHYIGKCALGDALHNATTEATKQLREEGEIS